MNSVYYIDNIMIFHFESKCNTMKAYIKSTLCFVVFHCVFDLYMFIPPIPTTWGALTLLVQANINYLVFTG